MTILEDIQNSAVDSKSDLATLLRKCKVLAARLNSQPLEDWLVWESNGYPDNIPVPEYRIWPLQVFGHFVGLYGARLNNAYIPVPFIPQEAREKYERYECKFSIAGIEATLAKVKEGNVQLDVQDLALKLGGTTVYQEHSCVQAWAEFGTGQLVEVLNSVRNRILDFALAIWKEAPSAGEAQKDSTSPVLKASRVTQIFNTTVYGGAANLVGTASDSSIAFNIGPKDFSSLERILVAKGVSTEDVGDLKAALDSDPLPTTPESFGPKVASWMGMMVAKAASGGWGIGINAAGNLLSQAITKYYGL